MKFDSKWFRVQLELNGINQSELARQLDIPREFISRLVGGQRDLRLEEAVGMARIFNCTLAEVVQHCGISVRGVPSVPKQGKEAASGSVKVLGSISGDFKVAWGSFSGPQTVDGPSGVGFSGKSAVGAFRLQTAGSRIDGMDGGIAFVQGELKSGAAKSPESLYQVLGKLALVREGVSGEWLFGAIRRGYSESRFNVLGFSGEVIGEDLALDLAIEVKWLKL